MLHLKSGLRNKYYSFLKYFHQIIIDEMDLIKTLHKTFRTHYFSGFIQIQCFKLQQWLRCLLSASELQNELLTSTIYDSTPTRVPEILFMLHASLLCL